VLTTDAESVRRRQVTAAARRLASAQKQALSDAARSGRIGEHVARTKSKTIEVAYEEGELTRGTDGRLDPALYPDEEAAAPDG
jgi:hypothetical protein